MLGHITAMRKRSVKYYPTEYTGIAEKIERAG